MSGLGGATHSHVWSDFEFLDSHSRLSVHALHRAGALRDGAETVWQWPNGLQGRVRATHGEIFLSVVGNGTVATIRIDWLPFLNNRYVRPRFLCPGCGRGAYYLHDRAGTWACRKCCRYEHRSRHRQRYSNAWRRIAKLRKQLGASQQPLSPVPLPPRWGASKRRWRRLVAELARAERAACSDISRLLATLERRGKTKA